MLRVIASLLGIPVLLVVLLAAAIELHEGKVGSLTAEIFELGVVPLVLVVTLVLLLVFLPLLGLASKMVPVAWWSAAVVGFLSALLPVTISAWSKIADPRLRLGFRAEQLVSNWPWLAMGLIGGLLFWLLAVFRNPTLAQREKNSPVPRQRSSSAA